MIPRPKKIEITEDDLSIYKDSGINFKRLVNSRDLEVRYLTGELHNGLKNIKDIDSYVIFVEDIQKRALKYHEIECRDKPPIVCAWKCDVWKLLHLCLYLLEKKRIVE